MTSRSRLTVPLFALVGALFLGLPAHAAITAPYVPGELLIKFKTGLRTAERTSLKDAMRATTMKNFAFINVEQVKLSDLSVEDAIARYKDDPRVQYVEPNYILRASLVPNDPRFPEMYGLRNTGQTGGTPGDDIHAVTAWDTYTGDPNLMVGDIDTGLDYNHPDIAANVWTNPGEIPGNGIDDDGNGYVDDVHGYDFFNNDGDPFDDHGHGTHTAGTIAAVGNNGVGVVGVAWHARLVAIKFLSSGGSGSTAGAISSVQYAITVGCKLTSNSWGGGGFSQALLDAINAAGAAGQLFVAAAGNSNVDTDVSPNYPSAYDTPYIIAVGASDDNDVKASFSNFGATTVDLFAPGVDILSTVPTGSCSLCDPSGYTLLSGTSMATPHTSGAVALAMGRFPAATNLQIKQLILVGVDTRASLSGLCLTGGRLNAFMAIAEPDSTPPSAVIDLATSNPGSNTMDLSWTAPGDDGNTGRASRYEVRYSTAPINDGNFSGATLAGQPDPQTAGSPETFTVNGLSFSTLYHFAVKAFDEFGNSGPVSNDATGTTLGAPDVTASPTSFSEELYTGGTSTQSLQLTNDGEGTLDFTVPNPEILFGTPVIYPFVPLPKGAESTPGPPVIANSGGPDGAGYRWIDSDEPGGPAFGWVDITGVGTQLSLTGDDVSSAPVAMGLSFPFYGNPFTDVRVCTNGFLSFTDATAPYTNQPLPNGGAPANLVAPFWDDLDFGATPRVYTYNDGTRFIVEYVGAPHYSSGGPYTFEVILYPSGEIRYQYLDVGSPDNSATVGIQNAAKTIGLNVVANATYVHNNLAVKIVPLRQWLTVSPASGRLHAGESANLDVHFDAAGLAGGIFNANVHVLSNDPDEGDLSLPAQLHVIGVPDIDVNPTAVSFGSVFVGSHPTRNVLVSNPGTDQLNISSIVSDDPELVPSPTTFSLAPSGSQLVTLAWSPTTAYALNAHVAIASDDPDEPSVQVTATGEATPAPSVGITPESLSVALLTNTATSRTVHLSNTGGSNFNWTAAPQIITGGSALRAARPLKVAGDAENIPRAKGEPDVQFGPAPLAAGGPDAFGYTFKDSDEPGGPGFAWEDIRAVGTQIALTGDDAQTGPLPVGFSFPYYGSTFSTFRICTNGWVSFTNSTLATFTNTSLPNSGASVPENMLAVFWDDMNFGTLRDAYYYSDGSHLVIQYQDVPRFGDATHPNTFEIILYPDGRFVYQYLTLTAPTLNSATIGMQNAARNDGLQVVFNASYVHNNLAIRFLPPARWLTVTPESGSIPPGGGQDLTVGFNAGGLFGGTYEGRIVVTGNDPIQPVKNVGCRLDVTGVPDIDVTPGALAFGNTYIGDPQTLDLTVNNLGTDSLRIQHITSDHPDYSPDVDKFTLGPLSSRVVHVTFDPAAPGAKNGTLTLQNNDPDEDPVLVAMTGNGVIPPEIDVSPSSLRSANATTLGPLALSKTKHLLIRNLGGSDLNYSTSANSGFTVAGSQPPLNKELEKGDPGVAGAPHTLASGGPDGFGYRWVDSDSPTGPPFAWEEISGLGTAIGLNGDDQTLVGLPLPFAFNFYGNSFNSFNICSNGWVSFTSTLNTYTNTSLPNSGSATPENLLAAFWDDQDFRPGSGSGQAFYYYDGTKFIVEYKDVPHYPGGAGNGPYTYEIFLYPNGTIDYQYLTMTPPRTNEATIGIQDASKTIGLEVVFDAAYVHDGLRIRFSRRPPFLSASPAAGTIPAGGNATLDVGFDATEYEDGDYSGEVRITSNDLDEHLTAIPCDMHVGVEQVVFNLNPDVLSPVSGPTVQGVFDDAAFVNPASAYVNRSAVGTLDGFVSPTATFDFNTVDVLALVGEGKGVPVEGMGEDLDRTWFVGIDSIKVIKPEVYSPLHALGSGLAAVHLQGGTPVSFTWQDAVGEQADHYELWASSDRGTTWALAAANLTSHQYVWSLPSEPSETEMVELIGYRGPKPVAFWLSDPFVLSGSSTGVGGPLPIRFALSQLGSNPARNAGRFELAMPTDGPAEVQVHDLRGALVRTVARGAFPAGRHPLTWDGTDASGRPVATGIYFVKATAGGRTATLRFVLLR